MKRENGEKKHSKRHLLTLVDHVLLATICARICPRLSTGCECDLEKQNYFKSYILPPPGTATTGLIETKLGRVDIPRNS